MILSLALKMPLPARLGWRNALRHKRQTAVVVVGLLVGTAVVSASLTTGDSLETGLKSTSIAALGDMDVLVRVPGELYVPERLLDELVAHPLPAHVAGTSKNVIARGAVEAPATDRYEARVPVVGFDAQEDAAFGTFRDAETGASSTGEGLGPGELIVNKRLADRLLLAAGDPVNLTYRPAVLPFVPEVHWANGTLLGASATPDPDGGWTYHHAPGNENEAAFQVPDGALGVVAVVLWEDPADTADLDVELVDPTGASHRNDTGMPGSGLPLPEGPRTPRTPGALVSEHTEATLLKLDREQAVAGEWTLRVHAKNALQQGFVAFAAVLEPEYDVQRALAAFEDLQEEFGREFIEDLLPDASGAADARTARFTVKQVVEGEGKGGFFGSPTVFMDRAVAQELYEVEGRSNWLKITHRGSGLAGVERSDETVEFIEQRLQAMRDERGDDPSSPQANLEVTPIKKEFIELSEEAAALFTRFLALVGSFTLVAGMLLIVNLFTMLGEERRRELGMVRALGLGRARMAYSLLYEGGLYTLVAAAVGALVGIAIAGVLVLGLNTLSPPGSLFHVPLAPRGGSLVLAFAVGALLTFATVMVAAVRSSRFDVASALRDEEDPAPARSGRRRRLQVSLFIALVVFTLAGALLGSFLALSMGPLLALFAVAPLLVGVLGRERAWRTVSILVVLAVLASLLFLRTPLGFEGDVSTVMRALALIVAGSVYLVHAPLVPRLLSRAVARSARAASVVRVALAYPLKRPMRTGLTVSMYSLVILVLVVFSLVFTVMTPDPARESGGYDLVGRAPVLLEDEAALRGEMRLGAGARDPFERIEHVDALSEHREFGEERVLIDGEPPTGRSGSAWFIGFDAPFAAGNEYTLFDWDRSVAQTERGVWQAVAADPGLVLVSYALVGDPTQPRGGEPELPERVTVNMTGGQQEFRVAGVTDQVHLSALWMQREEMERMFPQAEGLYLVRLNEGAGAQQVSGDLERSLRGIGMQVTSVEEEAAEVREEAERVYLLLSTYLGLGILVGVASLGIVTSRAVLERRRETGMLRAIGYTRRRVAAVLLTEALYLLALAMVLGLGLGLLVARAVYEAEISTLPGTTFVIPWGRILALLGIALMATLVAVGVPVHRAGKTPPSAAIRSVD